MTKPKLTIKKRKPTQGANRLCYIANDIHHDIKELSAATNVPMTKIIDKFIRYGLKNVEIVDEKDDSETDD